MGAQLAYLVLGNQNFFEPIQSRKFGEIVIQIPLGHMEAADSNVSFKAIPLLGRVLATICHHQVGVSSMGVFAVLTPHNLPNPA